MSIRYILLLILGVDALILFFQTSELSISYHEASLLYDEFSFLQLIIKSSIYIFGNNDFALRLPMIFIHLLSALLLFGVSKSYLKHDKDRLWLLLIFVLIPGVISSALLVDSAGMVIFGLLLFVYIYGRLPKIYSYILLTSFVFINANFLYLFLALILFCLKTKEREFLIFNILAFITSIYMYGFDTKGLPEGHFLDILGIYSAIFTPILFIYIFYILYRKYLTKQTDLLWFIAVIPFIVSLLLSFRQRVEVEQFAPYLIVALPLAVQTFSRSYRVRLKEFRKKYRYMFSLSLVFLLFNTLLVLFNKELYLILDDPKKHFAYKAQVAKELSLELKKMKIVCVETDDEMSKRLLFYGITKCNNNILREIKMEAFQNHNVTISYKNQPVYFANVTKLNNK